MTTAATPSTRHVQRTASPTGHTPARAVAPAPLPSRDIRASPFPIPHCGDRAARFIPPPPPAVRAHLVDISSIAVRTRLPRPPPSIATSSVWASPSTTSRAAMRRTRAVSSAASTCAKRTHVMRTIHGGVARMVLSFKAHLTRERNEGRTLLLSRVVEHTAAATELSVSAITHLTEDGCAALPADGTPVTLSSQSCVPEKELARIREVIYKQYHILILPTLDSTLKLLNAPADGADGVGESYDASSGADGLQVAETGSGTGGGSDGRNALEACSGVPVGRNGGSEAENLHHGFDGERLAGSTAASTGTGVTTPSGARPTRQFSPYPRGPSSSLLRGGRRTSSLRRATSASRVRESVGPASGVSNAGGGVARGPRRRG